MSTDKTNPLYPNQIPTSTTATPYPSNVREPVQQEEPTANEVPPAPQVAKYHTPFTAVKSDEEQSNFTLPVLNERMTGEEMSKIQMDIEAEVKKTGTSKETVELLSTVHRALSAMKVNSSDDGEWEATFDRTDSNWVQYLTDADGRPIRTGHVQVNADGGELSGQTAMRFLSKFTGVGSTNNITLWNSGLVLVLEPFKERSMLNLNILLRRDRVQLGANTRGASFTGDDVYVVTSIINFILEHVIDCNLEKWSIEKIKGLLLPTDIPLLLSGAAAVIYPGGYPIYHPCKNVATKKCTHAVKSARNERGDFKPDSMLDFNKVNWIDQSRFTPVTIAHIAGGLRGVSRKDIRDYQMLLAYNTAEVEVWRDGERSINVVFETKTVKEYERVCRGWINRISGMVDRAMSGDTGGLSKDERTEQRQSLLSKFATTLDLQKHVNWINRFVVYENADAEGIVIRGDTDTLDSLEVFNQLDSFTENLIAAVQVYKEQQTVAMTGLPNFKCPECLSGQADPKSKHPTLIPMNMVGYFFTIMEWKLRARQLAQ